jgi:hypothetical protein
MDYRKNEINYINPELSTFRNYLKYINQDVLYIILTYLDTISLSNVSNEFELHVNYNKLLSLKYPKSASKLFQGITDIHLTYLLLNGIDFNDDIRGTCIKYIELEHYSTYNDIIEGLYHIQLKREYPEIYKISKNFRPYLYKNRAIYEAMYILDNFNDVMVETTSTGSTSYVHDLIFNKIGPDQIVLIDIMLSELYKLPTVNYICLSIIMHKYNQIIIVDSELFNYLDINSDEPLNIPPLDTPHDFTHLYNVVIIEQIMDEYNRSKEK